jgi:subfamily B ATP-binding cassette protein MsbA
MTWAVLVSLVAATAASLWASLVGPLLQALLKGGDVTWGPLALSRSDLVFQVPLAVVGLAVIKAVASWLQAGLTGRVSQRVLAGLRVELYSRLLELPPAWFERRHSGELLSRFTTDVAQVEFAAAHALSGLLKDTLQLVGLLVVCFVTDWRLFFVVFLVLPGTVVPVSRFARSAKKAATRSLSSLGTLSMMASEQLAALPVVQALRAEGAALARFDAEQDRYLKAMKRSLFIRGAFSPTTELLGIIGIAAAVVLGTRAVMVEPQLAGKLVSFLTAALLMYQPAKSLSNLASEVSRSSAALTRLHEVLDSPPDREPISPCPPLTQALELDSVRLVYPDGREGLLGLSLRAEAGTMVALVGPSGAGKSSVLSVLLGFSPYQGSVRWDGTELSALGRRTVRAQIGWVPQEPILLSGSVRQNLLLGRPDAADDALWVALTQAHAAGFVRALPSGLEEDVGERGCRLSGGQRQRLAIARAFLRQPSLLLLDEPTSALDAASEVEVQAGLAALMAGRTTLVVAHRLSTVRKAGHIVVLEGGRAVAAGTHEALLAQGGLYARLVAAARGDQLG